MYVKVSARWRYIKLVVGKNNKLRPDYAVIGGVATHVPNAGYYLAFAKVRRSFGANAAAQPTRRSHVKGRKPT
jgi:hypothetical protein